MRTLEINKRKCWFSNYAGKQALTDTDGNLTGEYEITYTVPSEIMANISSALSFTLSRSTGSANEEATGVFADYDKTLVMDYDPGFTETSVFFIDKAPEEEPPYLFDYRVRRISRSLNFVSVALVKVRDEP